MSAGTPLSYEQTDWNQEVRDNDQNASDDSRLTSLENKAIFNQVNVKDYGAVGDGVTDDTSAIQSALDEGTYIVFDKGTYLFTSFTLSSNTIIDGNGAILKSSGENVTSIFGTGKSNIIIKNLEIYGSATEVVSKTGYQYHGIYLYNSSNIKVENCVIHDMPSGGMLFVDCSDVSVNGNYLYNNLDMFDIAFGYGNTGNEISGFVCTNNICESPNRYGIHVQGIGENFLVEGNTVVDKGEYGIMLYRLGTGTLRKARVVNNYIEDVSHNTDESYYSGMGIYLQTVENVICSNNNVVDVLKNRPDTTTNRTLLPSAISISSCSMVTCVGNSVFGSGKDGIGITKTATDNDYPCVVSNNVIRNVGDCGIYAIDLNNTNITNNIILNSTTSPNGILVSSSSSKDSSNIIVSGNQLTNSTNGILITKGTGSLISNITVSQNIVQDIANSYINASSAKDLVISGNTCKAKTVAATSVTYVIQLSSCSNASVSNNICTGESSYQLARGIIVSNGVNVSVNNNVLDELADIAYSIYESGTNTQVSFYGNITDRQATPYFGDTLIAQTTNLAGSSQNNTRVIYRSSIPVSGDGYFGIGSICYNLAPTVGGNIGWSCVLAGTPGTWKTFGSISA